MFHNISYANHVIAAPVSAPRKSWMPEPAGAMARRSRPWRHGSLVGSFKSRQAAMTPSRDIARLIEIMAALRTPGTGCPWDLEQSFATIAPYTLEEAYE